MSNYQQKRECEIWVCKCGIKRKIREKNKQCPYCGNFPKKEEKETATRSRILRHLNFL